MKKLIGIDLGGTSAKFAVLTADGKVEQKWSIPTNIENEGANIVPDIIASINQHLDENGLSSDDFSGIGMGSPGSVDLEKGTVIGAYNLNWRTLQLVKEQITAGTGISFYIDNDANVAALGEQWKGAGEGSRNVVFVTLGTGVGGGVVSEGQLVHGQGAAGEIGHITVDPTGYECTCGKTGCLETVASATGVVRLAKDHAKEYAGESELKHLIENDQEVTAKTIFDLAKTKDAFAEEVIEKFYFYLGWACANISHILHPETIVIGGGVSAAGQMLIEGVEKYFNKYTFPPIKSTTKIKLAQLGNDAGVIGAASLVKIHQ